MKIPLTKKQAETLSFLIEYNRKNGYMPTIKETAEEFSIANISAYERMKNLQKKNWISRTRNQPREIIIL